MNGMLNHFIVIFSKGIYLTLVQLKIETKSNLDLMMHLVRVSNQATMYPKNLCSSEDLLEMGRYHYLTTMSTHNEMIYKDVFPLNINFHITWECISI